MRDKRLLGRTNLIDKQDLVQKKILEIARRRKQTIYGARSIQAQASLFARDTKDYDIFDKNPKFASQLLKKELNRIMGINYYFNKPAKHKGTWKVKGKGADMKAETEDDESIADYSTNQYGKYKTVFIKGNRYRDLKKEIQRKKATLKDPEYEFRKEKDQNDLNRIKGYLKVKCLLGEGCG